MEAFNAISSQTLTTQVLVVEVLDTMTLTSDLVHAKVNEAVTFTGALQNGSHINYTIDFGDGVSIYETPKKSEVIREQGECRLRPMGAGSMT